MTGNCNDATVQQRDNATTRQCNDTTGQRNDTTMQLWDNATAQQHNNARQIDNTTIWYDWMMWQGKTRQQNDARAQWLETFFALWVNRYNTDNTYLHQKNSHEFFCPFFPHLRILLHPNCRNFLWRCTLQLRKKIFTAKDCTENMNGSVSLVISVKKYFGD